MFLATILMRLFLASGIVAAAMTLGLVIYGNTLSIREDDQLYLNKAEQTMASEQRKIVGQMRWLARLIYAFAAITALLLLASFGVWVWIGLRS